MDLQLSNMSPVQVTPVVVDGLMYVTARTSATHWMPAMGGNLALPAAAHAGSGRQRRGWRQSRRRSRRRRVFMATDHAHLIALNRFTGALALGNRDGGLAPELQRHRRAAWWSAIW